MDEGQRGNQGAVTPPRAPSVQARSLLSVGVLAALIYGGILAFTDARKFGSELAAFHIWALPAALALVLAGYMIRIIRWHFYLRHHSDPVSPITSGLTFLSGFSMGVTPGKVGEVVKAYYLRERLGTPFSVSIATIIAERAMDVAALSLVMGAGLLALPSFGLGIGISVIALVGAAIFVLRSHRLVGLFFGLVRRIPWVGRSVPHLEETHGRLRPLLGGWPLAYGFALGLAAWALEPVAMWVLALGFGLELTLAQCALVFAAASIAGVLTMIPGGLGATEGGMVALLSLFAVPLPAATALTIATRLSTLWFGVGLGAVAVAMLRWTTPSRTTAPSPVP